MRAPAFRLAAGLAIGIFIADTVPKLLLPAVFAGAFVVLLATTFGLRRRPAKIQQNGLTRLVAATVIAVICGTCSYTRVVGRDSSRWRALLERSEEVEIAGRVARVATPGSRTRYTVDRLVVLPHGERLSGSLLVYAQGDAEKGPQPGSSVSVLGLLVPPPRLRNPHDFDYGQYLTRRGVKAMMYVDGHGVEIPGVPQAAQLIGQIRRSIRDNIHDGVGNPEAQAILVALMLGDRSGISPDLREDFVGAGLVHLLAVSGLHVMVVGFVFFNIAGPLLRRFNLAWSGVECLRVCATLLLLLGYMHLTGKPDSVVRAVVMASILIAAPLIRRNSGSLNSLWVAVAVILTFSPWSLFEAGFQLSVSAVGAIIALNPIIQSSAAFRRVETAVGKAVVANVSVTASATVGVAPVLLYHFGEVSFAGLLLNISSVPLTAVSLVSGGLAVLLGSAPAWVGDLGSIYAAAAEASLQMVVQTARLGSVYLRQFSVQAFPAAPSLLAIVSATWAISKKAESNRWGLLAAAAACLAIGHTNHLRKHVSKQVDVIFFDVGQGDATLIHTSSGRTMLIDAGDRRSGFHPAARSIVPHLRRINASKLDLLILSHAHSDHVGGGPELFAQLPVGRIAITSTPSRSRLFARIKKLADSTRTPITYVQTGDTLFLDESLSIQVLWPRPKDMNGMSENDRSIVLRIRSPGGTFLFTGDVEEAAESEVVVGFRTILSADVVKVAHHGSRTSSTLPLAKAVGASSMRPRHAIVSVGKRNRYGLPNEEVTERWRNQGYIVHQTGRDGAIWLTVGRSGIRLPRWSTSGQES